MAYNQKRKWIPIAATVGSVTFQKWDGKLPTVTSGAMPFIQVK